MVYYEKIFLPVAILLLSLVSCKKESFEIPFGSPSLGTSTRTEGVSLGNADIFSNDSIFAVKEKDIYAYLNYKSLLAKEKGNYDDTWFAPNGNWWMDDTHNYNVNRQMIYGFYNQ